MYCVKCSVPHVINSTDPDVCSYKVMTLLQNDRSVHEATCNARCTHAPAAPCIVHCMLPMQDGTEDGMQDAMQDCTKDGMQDGTEVGVQSNSVQLAAYYVLGDTAETEALPLSDACLRLVVLVHSQELEHDAFQHDRNADVIIFAKLFNERCCAPFSPVGGSTLKHVGTAAVSAAMSLGVVFRV